MTTSDPGENLTPAQIQALLAEVEPEDFDGHTQFSQLTPEQRLEWLSGAVQFYFETRRP